MTIRITSLLLLLMHSALAACGAAQLPKDARTTVLSLDGADCASCGDELATHLRAQGGVYRASFDKRRAEVTVVAAPSVDPLAVARTLVTKEKYTIVPGAGHGHYLSWASVPSGADVSIASKDGEDVPDLAAVLVAGKVTVVDFSAAWCEPCRKLDEHMMSVAAKRPDVAYRKLDVGDWDTALAKHYLNGIASLPYVIVFGKAGARIDAIAGLDLRKLDVAIDRGASP